MNLIENWRIIWFRRWSTWLAAVYAAFSAAMLAQPGMLLTLLGYLPDHAKGFAAGVAFVILFAIPVLVSLMRQPKLQDKVEEAKNAQPSTDR